MNNIIHVLPVNDLFTHDQKPSCWCNPKTEEHNGGLLIIHNSADRREDFEDEVNEGLL